MKEAFFCISLAILTSCNSSSFGGGAQKGDPANPAADGPLGGDSAVSRPASIPKDGFGADGSVCIEAESPVNFMIVLDTTGSMEASFDFVSRSIGNIVNSFKTIVPKGGVKPLANVSAGLVVYKDFQDLPNEVIPLTTDMANLLERLETFRTRIGGGGDGPENGFNAFQVAMDHMQQEGSAQSVKVVIVITDNYSHNDKAAPPSIEDHDYNVQPIIENFKKPAFKTLFVYDITPDKVPDDLLGSAPSDPVVAAMTPAKQWAQIRAGWRGVYPLAKFAPGRGFGFPFPVAGEIATPDPATNSGEIDRRIIAALTLDLETALEVCY